MGLDYIRAITLWVNEEALEGFGAGDEKVRIDFIPELWEQFTSLLD